MRVRVGFPGLCLVSIHIYYLSASPVDLEVIIKKTGHTGFCLIRLLRFFDAPACHFYSLANVIAAGHVLLGLFHWCSPFVPCSFDGVGDESFYVGGYSVFPFACCALSVCGLGEQRRNAQSPASRGHSKPVGPP
jgi:hypothetical protein